MISWRRSSRSGGGNACVEVSLRTVPAVRDSKDPAGPHLTVEPAGWPPLLATLKAGRFDL